MRRYVFRTPDQWRTGWSEGLLIGDAGAVTAARRVALPPERIAVADGRAPAVAPDGIAYWIDGEALCRRAADGAVTRFAGQGWIGDASQMIVGRHAIWVLASDGRRLLLVDRDSLAVYRAFPLDPGGVALAGDGRGGVWLLLADGSVRRWTGAGCAAASDVHQPGIALAAFPRRDRLAVLGADRRTITLSDAKPITLPSAFDLMAGDGRDRLFLAARGGSTINVLSADGAPVETIALPGSAIVGLAARGGNLLVLTADALLLFDASLAGAAVGSEGRFVTRRLISPPDGSQGGWLRADLTADLPEGAMLAIEAISTDQPMVAEQIEAELNGPASLDDRWQAARRWADAPLPRGAAYAGGSGETHFSAPLFDQAQFLWLSVEVKASPAGAQPTLTALRLLYPNLGLTPYLPAQFSADLSGRDPKSGDPYGDFRALVGALGTTTADLDAIIAGLGMGITAGGASEAMLDYVAGWIDLPWDQALSVARKRALLGAAGRILAERGLVSGILAFLRALMPDAAIRITDMEATHGGAVLGHGARLPLLVTGLPRTTLALGRGARLGVGRLPCGDEDRSGRARWQSLLRIDIATDGATQAELSPLLARLIDALLPVGTRAAIRWHGRRFGAVTLDSGTGFDGAQRLDGEGRLGRTTLVAARGAASIDHDLDDGRRLN